MVERMTPSYNDALALRDRSPSPAKIKEKLSAIKQLAEWEPWLFPEDDDG